MFKDYEKYLSKSLEVYLFVLMIIFILKIVGLDYFGLTTDNTIIINISNYLNNSHIGDLIDFILIYLQFYFYLSIICDNTKLYFQAFIGSIINYSLQIILMHYNVMDNIYSILSILIMIIMPIIINKKVTIVKQIKVILLISFYQLFSLFIRNVRVNNNYGNFLIDSILNIDQLLLLAITYNLYLMKGGKVPCGEEQEAGFSSLKKINLKKSLLNLQRNFQSNLESFKKKDKEEKLSIIIFIILSLIWNTLTLVIVLLIAKLNDTFPECVFILSSFWLSKGAFGKAFHFDSMILCFIVSNLTYYVLNRITTPLGISIFIPILLGVGLSYVTSKFVKKTYKPLYRGMPKELFEETILQVVDKDSDKYNICYEFYIDKKSDLSLSYKYNYSVAGIRKIKDRINSKIKRL